MNFDVSLFFNSALLLFIVLGLGALAGYFCERVGIVNIAIDGQMIFGALIFSIFGMIFNNIMGNLSGFAILIPIVISGIFSFLLSWLFGWLVIKLKLNDVIVGTAIILVVTGLATFLTQPLGSSISNGAYPKLKVEMLPEWRITDSFYGETIMLVAICVIIMLVSIVIINRTKFGLRFKAVGDNPNAVDAQGINVNKYKWYGMFISGILGAIAGSIFLFGGASMYPQSSYFEGNVAGLGFLSLAIVVSGGWKIPFISIASLVFAALVTCATMLSDNRQIINAIGEYANYAMKLIPFIVSFIVLIIFSRKGYAPKALGKPFDKTLR